MRNVSWFLLGIGLVVSYSSAQAQDAPLPKVQVIIDAAGNVRVIDEKTRKELPSTVIKLQAREPKVEERQKAEAQQRLEQARQALEKLLREQQKANAEKPKPKETEIDLLFPRNDRNKARVIAVEKDVRQAGSVDQKLDLLLRQMEELRRDVNQVKNKLEGKQPDGRMLKIISGDGKEKDKKPDAAWIRIAPMPGGPPVNKIDPDTLKQLQELFKKLESEQPDLRKKSPTDPYLKPRPADRSMELEQRLERALREIEEMHREIKKSKSAK